MRPVAGSRRPLRPPPNLHAGQCLPQRSLELARFVRKYVDHQHGEPVAEYAAGRRSDGRPERVRVTAADLFVTGTVPVEFVASTQVVELDDDDHGRGAELTAPTLVGAQPSIPALASAEPGEGVGLALADLGRPALQRQLELARCEGAEHVGEDGDVPEISTITSGV